MNERIRTLRKTLALTQQEFAEKLHIKRNTVATYETGKSNPSDAAISLICKTFGVNEKWLRFGDGEMLQAYANTDLKSLVEKYHLSHQEYIVLERFLNLDPVLRTGLIDYLCDIAAVLAGEASSPNASVGLAASLVETETL